MYFLPDSVLLMAVVEFVTAMKNKCQIRNETTPDFLSKLVVSKLSNLSQLFQ